MITKNTTTPKKKSAPKVAGTKPPTPKAANLTPYGTKAYRTAAYAKEYVGTQGTPIPAVILDIDGTLSDWGSSASKKVVDWFGELLKKHPDLVALVITARDHGSFGYDSSFNWLMHNWPHPFIGPFARAVDDPRYASEFKRELAQGFEDMGLYHIIGAADDNEQVIAMWKWWAKTHFTHAEDFAVLECSYTPYTSWRKDLPSKAGGGYSSYSYYGTGSSYTSPTKHRPWGTAEKDKWTGSNIPAAPPALTPGTDLTNLPDWETYLAVREGNDAYSGESTVEFLAPETDKATSALMLDRAEMEAWVAHDYPQLTPDDIANMDNEKLWDAVGLDYRQDLYDTIHQKHGGIFTKAELDDLVISELEELTEITGRDEAENYVDTILKYLAESDAEPTEEPTRAWLEDEAWANTDKTHGAIAAATDEQLKAWLAEAAPDNTGQLTLPEVAELRDEMDHPTQKEVVA